MAPSVSLNVSLSLLVVFLMILPFQQLLAGSVNVPEDSHIGFSGIEYHVPRNTRMVLYQYKAMKNKKLSESGEIDSFAQGVLESSNESSINRRRIQGIDGDLVGECGISIGNNTKPDLFSPKEQVVIIEGDVVNLGGCD